MLFVNCWASGNTFVYIESKNKSIYKNMAGGQI